MVQPGQRHVVALADRAVGVDEELRHDEQRDALRARRSAGDLGEHQVDDVLGEFVLGAGDPHLGAEQPVGAVVLWFGAGEDVGQRRARLGLRQRHRAGEPARQHRLEEGLDLLLRAELGQQVGVGHGQHEVARGADVGRREPGEAGVGHRGGSCAPPRSWSIAMAIRSAAANASHASLTSGITVTVLAVEARLVRVALLVVRREVPGGQLLAQVQDAVEGLAGVFGEPFSFGQLVDAQPFVEQKVEIAPRQQGGLHDPSSPRLRQIAKLDRRSGRS